MALVLCAAMLTGCDVEDKALAMEFMNSYFTAKVDPSQNGFAALSNLAGALTGQGGDPEVNAALQAKGVIDNMTKAETLAEEAEQAWEAGNGQEAESKLDEAMKLRPQDVSYRIRLSALKAEMGEIDEAIELVSGEGLDPAEITRQRIIIADYSIREYTRALENLAATTGGTVEQREFLYYKLAISWATAEQYFIDRGMDYERLQAEEKREYYERAFKALDT